MNCSQVRELLSALHDHELQPEIAAEVNGHLRNCPECSRLAGDFDELSKLAIRLRNVPLPPAIWPAIEAALDDQSQRRSQGARWTRSRAAGPAIAASLLLVAASTGILAYYLRPGHNEHGRVAVHFGQYLDEFDRNSDEAEQVLLANYAGRQVSLDEAARQLHYQPAAPADLPPGFTRDRLYLLRMPCCLCVQAIYKDAAGRALAVFEHVDDQPGWFGDRPTIMAQCHGLPTTLVQLDDLLAASWRRQTRVITLIGVRDLEEVSRLIEALNQLEPQTRPSDQARNGTTVLDARQCCVGIPR